MQPAFDQAGGFLLDSQKSRVGTALGKGWLCHVLTAGEVALGPGWAQEQLGWGQPLYTWLHAGLLGLREALGGTQERDWSENHHFAAFPTPFCWNMDPFHGVLKK